VPVSAIKEFLKFEAAGGILLALAAVVALILANTPLYTFYDAFLSVPVSVQVGDLIIAKPLLLWINDGLMAVFFFLVGLEIKREALDGELSDLRKAMLPIIAAVGGMVVPAGIYVLLNLGNPGGLPGWAIPAATDIAFALGVLSLLGARVPTALKVFLLALAIIDDLGAIIIIAIFYTADLSVISLVLAAICLVALLTLNLAGVRRKTPFILIGVVMWVCVLKSGVHATLAGVALAFFIPLAKDSEGESPLRTMEHALHPWVAYGILPLFALANAGVSFAGMGFGDLFAPVPLGIALGLFLGKQIGVVAFGFAAVRLGICRLPEGTNWLAYYGVALLTGIGFTMSLFIGTLAFSDPANLVGVRIGVIGGSILSGVMGYIVLQFALSGDRRPADEETSLRTGGVTGGSHGD